jgi:hypothetical protein
MKTELAPVLKMSCTWDTCPHSNQYKYIILNPPFSQSSVWLCSQFVNRLEGRAHTVFTGVILHMGTDRVKFTESTKVFMAPMSEETIKAYVKTGEPLWVLCDLKFLEDGLWKLMLFWNVKPSNMVHWYKHSGRAYCPHLHCSLCIGLFMSVLNIINILDLESVCLIPKIYISITHDMFYILLCFYLCFYETLKKIYHTAH